MSSSEFGAIPFGALGAVERLVDVLVLGEATAARNGRDVPQISDYSAAMVQSYPPGEVARRVLAAAESTPSPKLAAVAVASVVTSTWAQELAVIAAAVVYPLARTVAEHDKTTVGQALAGLVEMMREEER